MRLIDVDDLGVGRCSKDVLPAAYCSGWNGLLGLIEKAPTVDAVPVVHGRWIEQEDPMLDVYYTCSVCKEDFYIETTGYTEKDMFLYTYCPNCGARMDGGSDALD